MQKKRTAMAPPDFPGAYSLRAYALAEYIDALDNLNDEGRTLGREARAVATRVIAIEQRSALGHLALGFQLKEAPNFVAADRNLRRALQLAPDFRATQFA